MFRNRSGKDFAESLSTGCLCSLNLSIKLKIVELGAVNHVKN